MESLYLSIPDAIILDLDFPFSVPVEKVIKSIKKTNFLIEIPIVIICTHKGLKKLDFKKIPIDDFLLRPLEEITCIKRLELIKLRTSRTLDANPLTKLPGNTSIIYIIQTLIEEKKDFALGYVDLNNFKAYNDKYGFSRGDEVIKMLARVLTNLVNEIPGELAFVGHIGGDDFVFIVPPDKAETLAEQIISYFDEIIPSFYDEEDRERGKIISKDRQGNIREFPIMTVAIAIVKNCEGFRLRHYGEVVKIATELKEYVKKFKEKSMYMVNRRRCP